jgi:cupin superfamily acireductone dioxygenase involved in methionine salvage
MPISVVTPEDWQLSPPVGHRKHPSMMINPQGPHLRILDSEPHFYTGPHSHSEPEVMIVLKGRMIFNGQWVGPGTVVYVPANEDYWHTAGPEGCVVALMRPRDGGIGKHAAVGAAE